jgi:hypothetical protein
VPLELTFDSGTVPEEISGTTGGIVDRADAVGGTAKALRFLDIDDNEETYFELSAFAAPGDSLTVRYEVSSENNYDFFRILIDGTDVLEPGEPGVSGDGDGWQEFTTALDPGSHTIRFLYTKDSSADDGEDTAFISSITYPAPVGVLGSLTSQATGNFKLTVRYWQVLLQGSTTAQPDIGDGTWLVSEIAEMEFRETVGGAAIPLVGGTTFPPYKEDPIWSTVFDQYDISVIGGHGTDKAFDGNPATTLRTVGNRYCIGYTFASPVHVAEIAITAGSTLYDSYEAFQLQWSEDGYRGSNGSFKNADTFEDQVVANLWGQVEWGAYETRTISWADQDEIFGQPSVGTFASEESNLNPAGGLVLQLHSAGVDCWVKAVIVHNWTARGDVHARGVLYAVDAPNYPKPGLLVGASVERTSLPSGWTRYEFDPPVFVDQAVLIGVHADVVLTGGPGPGVNFNDTFDVTSTYGEDPVADLSGATAVLHGRQLSAYAVYTLTEPPGATPDEITGNAANALGVLTGSASGTASLPPITGTASLALADLTGTASGSRELPNTFSQRIALMGTKRPTKSLNATWVPR